MVKNALGREVPEYVSGYGNVTPYKGVFKHLPTDLKKYSPPVKAAVARGEDKLLDSLKDVFVKLGIKDGMTLSFHHHFREGDKVLNAVIDTAAELGLKNLKVATSGIMNCHHPLVKHFKSGVVTHLDTNGLMGAMADYVASGKMENPVVLRSHGGRARAIETGQLHIDVAFIGASCADRMGNLNGCDGESAFGSLGYAIVDGMYADNVVGVTDTISDYPLSHISVPQTRVDYIVKLEEVGDVKGISTGSLALTKDPIQLGIAKEATKIVDALGLVKDGYSFQTGSGGPSLAFAGYMSDMLKFRDITGGFVVGGITAYMVQMLEDGVIRQAYDTQSFDLRAAKSVLNNPKHVEMGADYYASPMNSGCIVNYLDTCLIGGFELDTDFNLNCLTGMDGVTRTGIGGNPDTAAGSALTIVTANLIRSRVPTIVDRVHTLCTPGDSIDIIVTDRGTAVNPKRQDIIEKLTKAGIKLHTIEELKEIAERLVGKPEPIQVTDKVVAIIEYRDGTVIDTIKQVVK